MKKYWKTCAVVIAIWLVPVATYALTGKLGEGYDAALGTAIDGGLYTSSLKSIIFNGIAFILSLAAVVALAALVWAGFLYISAFTNEDNVEKAKKIALWAVTGLITMGASFMVLKVVQNLLK